MSKYIKTDIAVIGAGPAGATLSIFLAKRQIPHIIFDKTEFPRDKICGDGLSGKVVHYLRKMNNGLLDELNQKSNLAAPSWGVRFVAPNGKAVDVPFYSDQKKSNQSPGYIIRRIDFDNILVNAIDKKYADIKLNTEVKSVEYTDAGIILKAIKNEQELNYQCEMVIGAGGDRSIVAKKLAGYAMQPEHYYAGLRTYYENVSGMHDQNFIELHFIKDLLPGYFWIFPLPNNQVNVGLGVLTNQIKEKNINLKKTLQNILNEHPTIKERFKNARPIDEVRGWGLPLASSRKRLSGERFLLIGDAGSLIDPLTGEGIGNAMQSAHAASKIIERALIAGDFSEEYLSDYDKLFYDELKDELRLSEYIQRLVQKPWLFNFVFNRLHKNKSLQEVFTGMLSDLDLRAKLRSPGFYFKILFNR
ncbi:MAG: geranylgeranyl reductase family protein [Calditrichaceae bacterium]|nr:geranylgeranyl reductase family protein [Calditrichaceae bacterium]HES60100.1 geranylgeranyl reductase family protein [Caldithrix sp.]